MDDPELTAHFAPFTERSLIDPTPVTVLARRADHRRRARRASGAIIVTLAVVAAVIGGTVLTRGDAGTTIKTGPATSPSERSTTTVAIQPVHPAGAGGLVITAVPDGFDIDGCSMAGGAFGDPGATGTFCGMTRYVSPVGGSATLFLGQLPADRALIDAWERDDAAAATEAILENRPTGTFRRLASRRVLDLGSIGNAPSGAGQPVVPNRLVVLLIGNRLVQITSPVLTDDDLSVLVAGLGTEPIDLGFDVAEAALPSGLQVVSRSRGPVWVPVAQMPNRQRQPGVRATVSYQSSRFDGATVSLVTGVDANAYLAASTAFAPDDSQGTFGPREIGGRRGFEDIGRPYEGPPGAKSVRVWLVDGDDVIEVSSNAADPAVIEAIAAGVTVRR